MNNPENTDRIVYLLVANPGGVDGLDHTDKGGTILNASFIRSYIECLSQKNPWSHIEKRVVDVNEESKKALKKLNPLEKLILGVEETTEFLLQNGV